MTVSISLDCNDLDAQTHFWCEALEYEEFDPAPMRLERRDARRSHVGSLAATATSPALRWIIVLDPEGNEFCVQQVDRTAPG
ncbi:MAG TPA: hypothetical protein VFW06_07345 [Acidimicrobiia bacterium]|nr:hypothetical protein [Acidimicrobiia bacterium]